MLDTVKILEDKIAFYNRPELIENPHHPAGFRGTWAFSDHSLIPEVLFGFLQRHFGIMRLRRISLDQINSLMNEVWEGPGSLEKIFRLEQEMILSGKTIKIMPSDVAVKAKVEEEEDDLPDLPLSVFGNESLEDEDDSEEK
jgi:hypothetical protein